MTLFVLYILCFIGAWKVLKAMRNYNEDDDNNKWSDVRSTFVISLFGPLFLLVYAIQEVKDWWQKTDRQPPKWM